MLNFRRSFLIFASCFLLIACDKDKDNNDDDDSDVTPDQTPAAQILGSPSEYAFVGETYQFQFTSENFGEGLSYSLQNNPLWLEIDASTGLLFGTPATADIDTYNDIEVLAADNAGGTANLTIDHITVPIPPNISKFTASRIVLVEGEATTILWNTENASAVSLMSSDAPIDLNGDLSVNPVETTTYTLSAQSEEGQVVERSVTIEVRPLVSVTIDASKNQGNAPFTVSFTPVVASQNAVNRYYWDFEGDGGTVDGGLGIDENGFDQVVSLLTGGLIDFDSTGRSQEYTYPTPGTYTARLRIWDADGNQTDTTFFINVENEAPIVLVTTNITNGSIPLLVRFYLNIQDNEGISNIRWDFESDGTIDQEGTATTIDHLFEVAGDFQVSIEVIDTLGASRTISLPHISIRAKPAGSNSVYLSASPQSGLAPLATRLTGTALIPSNSPITTWQWDFDGDGTVDQEGADRIIDHNYNRPGTYYPTVTVVTTDGNQAIDIKEVTVEPNISLSITGPTFNPEQSEIATIISNLQGTYTTQLDIVDMQGTLIKTLVPWQDRVTGVYSDTWDGKDNAGNIANPGAYFALLKYRIEGQEHVFDLRETTAKQLLYPGRCSRGLWYCGTLTIPDYDFEPFNNQPWVYQFTSNYIANFSSYMSVFTTNDLMKTFFTHRPFGNRGTHEIVWNGDDTDGVILPQVSTRYLITILGETLGDNAMFLDHGVRLQNFRAEPSIFYPKRDASQLSVSLSRPAQFELWVVNANGGGEVFRQQLGRKESGDNITLTWNGKNNAGTYLAPGSYRLSLRATDDYGYISQTISAMQRIDY